MKKKNKKIIFIVIALILIIALTAFITLNLFNKKEFSKEELKRLKELETKEISKREKQALIKGERFIKKD